MISGIVEMGNTCLPIKTGELEDGPLDFGFVEIRIAEVKLVEKIEQGLYIAGFLVICMT